MGCHCQIADRCAGIQNLRSNRVRSLYTTIASSIVLPRAFEGRRKMGRFVFA